MGRGGKVRALSGVIGPRLNLLRLKLIASDGLQF